MKNLDAMERALLEFGANIKILYVEDEASIRDEVIDFLSNYFDTIDSAVDGLDGLNLYKSGSYDLVISDISMPNMDGIEMCKAIKEINIEQNILIMSAHSDSNYLLSLVDIGIDNYIVKPIDDEKLIKTLYKISKRVIDAKFSLEYQDKLLDMNFKLDELNKELNSKNEALETLIKRLKGSQNKNIAIMKTIEKNPEDLKQVQMFQTHHKRLSREEFMDRYPLELEPLVEKLESISEDFDLVINKINKKLDVDSFISIAFYLR